MNDVSTTAHNSLSRLAAATGILPAYFDVHGSEHHTAPATQRALLAAMRISVQTDADVESALAALDSGEWKRLLPPVRVQSVTDARWPIEATLPKALASHALRSPPSAASPLPEAWRLPS